MRAKERLQDNFILLRQRFFPEGLISHEGRISEVKWVEHDGALAAFFPSEKTDFTRHVSGINTRDLANAFILGFVTTDDRLLVRFNGNTEYIEMVYTGFSGYRRRVSRLGESVLNHLREPELRAGINTNSQDILYWRKIEIQEADNS